MVALPAEPGQSPKVEFTGRKRFARASNASRKHVMKGKIVDFSPQALKELTYTAIKAARLGREVLLHYAGRLQNVQEKFQAGLVSEADKESERVISQFLSKELPDFDFLGEESAFGKEENWQNSEVPRWILDPLDGTTNYVHGLPVYAVSLGLEYRGEMLVGVIDAPAMNEVFTCWKGGGAYVNGRELHVSSRKELSEGLLATGFISDIEENLQEQLDIFARIVRQCRGVRRPGAAAMDLAWVAKGVFDGYWEKNLKPWDLAAGLLLVREAGGEVLTYRGKSCSPYSKSVVAGNREIVSKLVKAIQPDLRPDTV